MSDEVKPFINILIYWLIYSVAAAAAGICLMFCQVNGIQCSDNMYSVKYLCYVCILVYLAVHIWNDNADGFRWCLTAQTLFYATLHLMDGSVAEDAILAACKIPCVQII